MVPSRVRGDGGGENVRIASYIKRIGEDDKAFIEGSSKYNTRIERLWRDVQNNVIQRFI